MVGAFLTEAVLVMIVCFEALGPPNIIHLACLWNMFNL
jgi:hypothetical protein